MDVPALKIVDVGKTKRDYSPIRLTMDSVIDRQNEDMMILSPTEVRTVIKTIKDAIGVSKPVAAPPNQVSQDNRPKIPKITKSGQSITKKLLTPPKPVAGFNKPTINKVAKKKPIDELVELELNKTEESSS